MPDRATLAGFLVSLPSNNFPAQSFYEPAYPA